MAVIQTLRREDGRLFCVLLDPENDSVEVVSDAGFDADGSQLDFTLAHYEPGTVTGLGDVMVRIDEATGTPIGILVEGFSRRGRRRRLIATRTDPLAVLSRVIHAARSLPGEVLQDRLTGEDQLTYVSRGPSGAWAVSA